MENWLLKITTWLLDLVIKIIKAVFGFIFDIFIFIVKTILDAIASLLSLIPVPDFLHSANLGSLINQLPPFSLYIASKMHITQAFLILLSGVIFRLTRKFFTLGQW